MKATDEQIIRVKWIRNFLTVTNYSREALAAVLGELTALRSEVERLKAEREDLLFRLPELKIDKLINLTQGE